MILSSSFAGLGRQAKALRNPNPLFGARHYQVERESRPQHAGNRRWFPVSTFMNALYGRKTLLNHSTKAKASGLSWRKYRARTAEPYGKPGHSCHASHA